MYGPLGVDGGVVTGYMETFGTTARVSISLRSHASISGYWGQHFTFSYFLLLWHFHSKDFIKKNI